ncbi:hypothetical protein CASFOL_034582 [Castilleja foliolosa]|uniref:Uncharacterized protein n=1 Tax=Castilleja foliolosa TaxID=1961234 RepID=A0ABD3BQD6_9LAMI
MFSNTSEILSFLVLFGLFSVAFSVADEAWVILPPFGKTVAATIELDEAMTEFSVELCVPINKYKVFNMNQPYSETDIDIVRRNWAECFLEGLDGIVMSLSGLLAGTATNPFGSGFYQGPSEAPLEAATACPGVYAKGAYPGYAGDLLVEPTTGASYNALGPNGRKYLLPAIYDPSTSKCATLV